LPIGGGLYEQDSLLMDYFCVIENQIGVEEKIIDEQNKLKG